MAKSSSEQIEQDELKVLDALEQHSKDSIDEIAKICGFSRLKVSRIIKNLERNKVIWGYPPVTGESAKNLKHFIAVIKRNNVPLSDGAKNIAIFEKLDDPPNNFVKVENLYLTHGKADWVLTFYAPDLMSAKKFLDEKFKIFQNFIQEYFLIETLVSVRKQGLKNPQMKELAGYL